jgi:hypothetical protein
MEEGEASARGREVRVLAKYVFCNLDQKQSNRVIKMVKENNSLESSQETGRTKNFVCTLKEASARRFTHYASEKCFRWLWGIWRLFVEFSLCKTSTLILFALLLTIKD